jgi:hypothetical protein
MSDPVRHKAAEIRHYQVIMMPMRNRAPGPFCATLVAIGSLVSVATQEPAEAALPTSAPEPVVVRELLAVAIPAAGPSRTPVPTDPLLAAWVDGSLGTPTQGAPLDPEDPDGPRWQRITADEDGSFPGDRTGAGWCYAALQAPADDIHVLQLRGHRRALCNDRPLAGDPYDFGIVHSPVKLRTGTNQLFVRAGRRPLRIQLTAPRGPCTIESFDRTLPDLVKGMTTPLRGALLVTNATDQWRTDLRFVATLASGGESAATPIPALPPLSVRKIAFELPIPDGDALPQYLVSLRDSEGRELDQTPVELALREPHEAHRRTFVSGIDGSVQYYAVRPARPGTYGPESPAGLLLSLHGAGVPATNQAGAYASKNGVHVVAPTNRRPFGFDWEDWGRTDALEVLADAMGRERIDASRVWLSGHSMGGHGTWQLGVHLTDRFAAIAPSAGWRDFWSYGGAAEWSGDDPLAATMLARAVNPSRTLLYERNLTHRGVYVLHGDRDRSVPVDQARFMRARLGAFHPDFAYYERPGAGHWWGNVCLDWPPLISFLFARQRPDDTALPRLSFTSPSPAIASRFHWLELISQRRSLLPSRIDANLDVAARRLEFSSENVGFLTVDLSRWSAPRGENAEGETLPPLLAPGQPLQVVADGQDLGAVPWPSDDARLLLARSATTWAVAPSAPPLTFKGPHRDGPFKAAFGNRMLFVYGTRGTDEENAWAFDRARHDAAVFRYRGNGSVDILADVAFRAVDHLDRSVILYGNADTNAAFAAVLDEGPVAVEHDRIRVADRTIRGDDAWLLAIRPRAGSSIASVGIIGGTGLRGMRATDHLPLFVSGVAWPDWTVARASTWRKGAQAILGAGFFAPDWTLGDDAVWR